MNFVGIVGEFCENNWEEYLRIFWVNFKNIREVGENFEKISDKFWKSFAI